VKNPGCATQSYLEVWPGSVGVEDSGRILILSEEFLSKDTQGTTSLFKGLLWLLSLEQYGEDRDRRGSW
jgi:hypothetical protein